MSGDRDIRFMANVCEQDKTGKSHCRLEDVTEEAAKHAVKHVFAIIGVDVDKPESVEAFREDLRFGRRMRKIADHGTIVLAGAVFLGIAYAVWAGIVALAARASSGH